MTTDTATIKSWLESEYNRFIEIYDRGDHVVLTNGSMAHQVDIIPEPDAFHIEGERYGETFRDSCDPHRDALIETLGGLI